MSGEGESAETRLYVVSGRVQGVGYRYFAMRTAQELGVCGTVKNLRDGRVEVAAEADPETLARFRAELERGPRGAAVSGVSEEKIEARDFGGEFAVEYER